MRHWLSTGFLAFLLVLSGSLAEASDPLTFTLSANRTTFSHGDILQLSVGLASTVAGGPSIDIFVGVVLPDGQTVVAFGPDGAPGVGDFGHLAGLPPFLPGLSLAGPFDRPVQPVTSYQFTGQEPLGEYILFAAAVPTGALADNNLGPADLLALATRTIRFSPGSPGDGDWRAFSDSLGVQSATNTLSLVRSRAADACATPPAFPTLGLSEALASLVAALEARADGPALVALVTGSDPTRLPLLATTALAAHKAQVALAAFLGASITDPANPGHLINAAGLASLLGFPAEALGLLDAAEHLDVDGFSPLGLPGRALLENNRGHALLGLGRWADAEAALQEAVDLAPHLSEARTALGLAVLCQPSPSNEERAVRLFRLGVWRTLGPATPDEVPFSPVPNANGVLVTIETPQPTALEAPPSPGLFTVRRNGDLSAEITIPLDVAGTATPDLDYLALPDSVTLPAGVASIELPVFPVRDDQIDPDETVVVTLGPGAGYQLGTAASATVTIGRYLLPAGQIFRQVTPAPPGSPIDVPQILDLSAGVEGHLPLVTYHPTPESAEKYIKSGPYKQLGDLETQRILARSARLLELQQAINGRQPPLPLLTFQRISGVIIAVAQLDRDPSLRPLVAGFRAAKLQVDLLHQALSRTLQFNEQPYNVARNACKTKACQDQAYIQYYCNPIRVAHPGWLTAMNQLDAALRAYFGPATVLQTAVAANIADPLLHERTMIELVEQHADALFFIEVFHTAQYFAVLERGYFSAGTPCVPSDDQAPVVQGPPTQTDPGACPPALTVAKAQIKLSDVLSLSFNCETVELEVSEPGLGVFGQLGFKARPGHSVEATLFVGAKASLPGVPLSAKEGFFLRADSQQFTDAGFKVSVSDLIGTPVGGLKIDSPFNLEVGVAAAIKAWN